MLNYAIYNNFSYVIACGNGSIQMVNLDLEKANKFLSIDNLGNKIGAQICSASPDGIHQWVCCTR